MRSLALVLTLTLVVGIIGCGSSEQPAEPITEQTAEVQPAVETTAPDSQPAEPPAETPDAPEPAPEPEREPAEATGPLPKLYDFFAVWCPPCQDQKPIVAALEEEFKDKVDIQTIDVDKAQELSAQYEVKAIPTLVFIGADGKEAGRLVGLQTREKIVAEFQRLEFID